MELSDTAEKFFIDLFKLKMYDRLEANTTGIFKLIDQDFFMFPELEGCLQVSVEYKNDKFTVLVC